MNHPVNFSFILLHSIASVSYYYVRSMTVSASGKEINHYSIPKVWNLIAGDVETLPFTVIFAILLAGVEKSIGSINYLIEIIFCLPFIALARQFFSPQPTGATYLVFIPFFTFIVHHKPYYFFKIKTFEFTDSLFYSIALIEYILFDIAPHMIDLVATLFALGLWKVVVMIAKLCCIRRRNNEPLPQQ